MATSRRRRENIKFQNIEDKQEVQSIKNDNIELMAHQMVNESKEIREGTLQNLSKC